MQKQYDAIVVGLGAMGSSLAYFLAKKGLSVLGLEQFECAHALGSSHGKTRLIRRAYFEHPAYVPLLNRSYELWHDLEKKSGKRLLHETGLTIFGPPSSDILKGVRESSRLYDIPVSEFAYPEAVKRFSQFNIPKDYTGIFEAGAGYLEVENCVKSYCEEAVKLGADLRFETPVLSWKNDGKKFTVETNQGSFSASYGGFCAGPWTNSLLMDLPLKVHRVPQFWFALKSGAQPDSFAFDMPEGFMYGFPEIGGLVKVAVHLPGAEVNGVSQLDRTIHPEDCTLIESFVSKHIKTVIPKVKEASVCLYTMTPDQFFIVDNLPKHENLAVAAGFSGHGFKFASALGEVMTQLLLKDKSGCDIDFLRIKRF